MVNRFSLKLISVIILINCAIAASGEGKFKQKIEWKNSPNALGYKVELVSENSGAKKEVYETEKNWLTVSKPAGKYHYRIFAIDYLGRETEPSEWKILNVSKAVSPKITGIKNNVEIPVKISEDGKKVKIARKISIPVEVTAVSKKTSVELVNAATGEKVKAQLFVEGSAGSKIIVDNVKSGEYRVVVTNPGGLTDESSELLRISRKSDEEIKLMAAKIREKIEQENQARIAALQRKKAAEEAARKLAEEQARIAAQIAAEEQARILEAERIAAELAAKAAAEEAARIEAERIAKKLEEERLAAEALAAEKKRLEEEAEKKRIAAEKEREKDVVYQNTVMEAEKVKTENTNAEFTIWKFEEQLDSLTYPEYTDIYDEELTPTSGGGNKLVLSGEGVRYREDICSIQFKCNTVNFKETTFMENSSGCFKLELEEQRTLTIFFNGSETDKMEQRWVMLTDEDGNIIAGKAEIIRWEKGHYVIVDKLPPGKYTIWCNAVHIYGIFASKYRGARFSNFYWGCPRRPRVFERK